MKPIRLIAIVSTPFLIIYLIACIGCVVRPIIDSMAFPGAYKSESNDFPVTEIPVSDGATLTLFTQKATASPYHLLYFHGNAEDLTTVRFQGKALASILSLHAIDYRGYGRSTGQCSVATFEADALATYDYVIKHKHINPNKLIVMGYSMGGAAAAEIASKRPVAALVLESSFTSLADVPWFGKFLPFDYLRTQSKLTNVRAPIIILHGRQDAVIDVRHAHNLANSAPTPKILRIVPNGTHFTLSPYAINIIQHLTQILPTFEPLSTIDQQRHLDTILPTLK